MDRLDKILPYMAVTQLCLIGAVWLIYRANDTLFPLELIPVALGALIYVANMVCLVIILLAARRAGGPSVLTVVAGGTILFSPVILWRVIDAVAL